MADDHLEPKKLVFGSPCIDPVPADAEPVEDAANDSEAGDVYQSVTAESPDGHSSMGASSTGDQTEDNPSIAHDHIASDSPESDEMVHDQNDSDSPESGEMTHDQNDSDSPESDEMTHDQNDSTSTGVNKQPEQVHGDAAAQLEPKALPQQHVEDPDHHERDTTDQSVPSSSPKEQSNSDDQPGDSSNQLDVKYINAAKPSISMSGQDDNKLSPREAILSTVDREGQRIIADRLAIGSESTDRIKVLHTLQPRHTHINDHQQQSGWRHQLASAVNLPNASHTTESAKLRNNRLAMFYPRWNLVSHPSHDDLVAIVQEYKVVVRNTQHNTDIVVTLPDHTRFDGSVCWAGDQTLVMLSSIKNVYQCDLAISKGNQIMASLVRCAVGNATAIACWNHGVQSLAFVASRGGALWCTRLGSSSSEAEQQAAVNVVLPNANCIAADMRQVHSIVHQLDVVSIQQIGSQVQHVVVACGPMVNQKASNSDYGLSVWKISVQAADSKLPLKVTTELLHQLNAFPTKETSQQCEEDKEPTDSNNAKLRDGGDLQNDDGDVGGNTDEEPLNCIQRTVQKIVGDLNIQETYQQDSNSRIITSLKVCPSGKHVAYLTSYGECFVRILGLNDEGQVANSTSFVDIEPTRNSSLRYTSIEWWNNSDKLALANTTGQISLSSMNAAVQDEVQPSNWKFVPPVCLSSCYVNNSVQGSKLHVLECDRLVEEPDGDNPSRMIIQRSYTLKCITERSPDNMFKLHISNGNFDEAIAMGKQYALDLDHVYKAMWSCGGLSVESIDSVLSEINDKGFVLSECCTRIPGQGSGDDVLEHLLNHGILVTDKLLEGTKAKITNGDAVFDLSELEVNSIASRQEMLSKLDWLSLDRAIRARQYSTSQSITRTTQSLDFIPSQYVERMKRPVLEAAREAASSGEVCELIEYYLHFPKILAPHWASLLSSIPECVPVNQYSDLLPALLGGTLHHDVDILPCDQQPPELHRVETGAEETSDRVRIHEPDSLLEIAHYIDGTVVLLSELKAKALKHIDWTSKLAQNAHFAKSNAESLGSNDHIQQTSTGELTGVVVEREASYTPREVLEWYISRIKEIELRTGLVDNAHNLLSAGCVRLGLHWPGNKPQQGSLQGISKTVDYDPLLLPLVQLDEDLSSLARLVYHGTSGEFTELSTWSAMSKVEKVFAMANGLDASNIIQGLTHQLLPLYSGSGGVLPRQCSNNDVSHLHQWVLALKQYLLYIVQNDGAHGTPSQGLQICAAVVYHSRPVKVEDGGTPRFKRLIPSLIQLMDIALSCAYAATSTDESAVNALVMIYESLPMRSKESEEQFPILTRLQDRAEAFDGHLSVVERLLPLGLNPTLQFFVNCCKAKEDTLFEQISPASPQPSNGSLCMDAETSFGALELQDEPGMALLKSLYKKGEAHYTETQSSEDAREVSKNQTDFYKNLISIGLLIQRKALPYIPQRNCHSLALQMLLRTCQWEAAHEFIQKFKLDSTAPAATTTSNSGNVSNDPTGCNSVGQLSVTIPAIGASVFEPTVTINGIPVSPKGGSSLSSPVWQLGSPKRQDTLTRELVEDVVVNVAQEYFNSSPSGLAPSMAKAKECLGVLTFSSEKVSAERDLIKLVEILAGELKASVIPLQVRLQVEQANADKVGNTTTSGTPRTRIEHDDQRMENVVEQPIPFLDEIMRKNPAIYQSSSTFDSVPGVKVRRIANLLGVRDAIGTCQVNCQIASAAISHGELDVAICLVDDLVTRAHSIQPSIAPLIYSMCSKLSNSEQFISVEDNVRVKVQEYMLRFAPSEDLSTLLEKHVSSEMKELLSNVPTQFSWTTFDFVTEEVLENHSPQMNTVTSTSNWTLLENMQRLACFTASHIASNNSSEVCSLFQTNIHLGAAWVVVGMCEPRLSTIGASTLFQLLAHGCPCKNCRQLVSNDELNVSSHSQVWHEATKWLGILVDTATIKEVSRISIAKKVLATIETAAIALLNPESRNDVVKRLLYSISNRCLGTYLVWVHEQFDNVLAKSEMSHTSTLFADIQTCVTSMRNKVSALSSGVRIRDLCGSEVDVSRLATDQEYTRYMVGKAAMNIVPYALSSQHETQSNVSGFGQLRTPLELDSLLVDAYERELETIIEEAAAYGVEKEMVLAYFVTGVLVHDPCVVVEEACQEVARRHLCAGNALEILTKSCEQWILHLSLVTWNSLENSSPTWKFRFVLQLIEENIPAENKEWEPVRKSLKRKMAILSTFSKLPPHSKLPVGVVMRPPTKLIREVLQSEVQENYIARSPLHRNTEGIEHRVQKDEDTFDRTAARDAIVTCMSNLGVKDGKVFSRLVSKLDDFVPALPEGDVILSVMYQWVQLDRAPASASQMNTNGESVLAIDPSVLYSTGRQWKKCKELLAGGKLNWKQVADFGCKMCYDGGLLGIADIELRKTVVQECARTVAKRKPLRGDNDEEKVNATERLKNAECFLQALEALGHVVPSSMYDEQEYTTAVMHQLEYTQGNVDEINKLVAYVILFMNGSSSVLDTIVNYLGKGIMKECWGVEPSNWADMVYQKCATTVIENLLQAVQTKDNESSSIADVIEWPPRQVETATVHLNKLLDRLDDTSEPILVCDCIVNKQRVRDIVQNFAYEQRDVSNISNQEMKVKIIVLKACEAHGIKSVSSETICSSDPGSQLGKVNSTAAAHDGFSTTPDAAQSDLGKLYACYDIITTSWSREEVDHTKLHMDDVSSQQQVVMDMINTTSCEYKERLVEVARTLKLLDPRVPLCESHHTGVLSMYQVEIATMRALNKLGIDSVGEPRCIEFDSPLISCWESLFMRLAQEGMHDKVLEYLRTSHHSAFSLSLQSELDLIRVCLEGGTGLNPKNWIETICIGLLSPHQEVVDIAAEVLTSKCPDGLNDSIMESTWLSSSLHQLFTSCVVACCDLFQVSRCPVWQGLIAGLKSQNVQDVAMIESHPWMVVNLVINELIFQAASVVQAVRQTPHNLWCGDTAFVALEQYLLRVVRFIDPTCATFQQGYWSDLVSLAQRALDIVRQPQQLSRPNTSTESSEVFPKHMNGWDADFELDDSSSEVDWSTDRRNSGTSRSFVEPAGSKEAIAREMNSVNGWGDDDLEFEDNEVEVADECQHAASITAEAKVTMDEASNSQAGWGDDDIDLEDSETETAVVDEPDEPITEATAAATEVAATSQARWGDEDIDLEDSGTETAAVDVPEEPVTEAAAAATEVVATTEAGWGDEDIDLEESETEATAEVVATTEVGWGDRDIGLEGRETETADVDVAEEPVTEATAKEVVATSQGWGDDDIDLEESETETAEVGVAEERMFETDATEAVATTKAGWGDDDIDLEGSETDTAAVDVTEEPIAEAAATGTVATTEAGWGDQDVGHEGCETETAVGAEEPITEAATATEVVSTSQTGWGDDDIDLEESETEATAVDVPEEPVTEAATATEIFATSQVGWGDDDIDLEGSETETADVDVPEEPIAEAAAAEVVATTAAGWGDDDIDLEDSETGTAGAEVPEEPIAEAAATKAVVTTETGWGDEDIDLEDSETETAAVDVAEEPITEDTAKEVVATSEAGWGDQDVGHEGSETEIADADVPEEPIAEASAIEAVATTEAGWGDEDIDLEASETETAVVDVAEEPVTEAATATEVVATTQAGWGDDDIDLEVSETETATVDVPEEPVTEAATATQVVATSQTGWGDEDIDLEVSETETADVDIPEEPITEATAAEVVATTKAGWGDDDIDLEESETETAAVEVPEEPVTEATAAATQVVATTEAGWGDDDIDVEESETETAAVDVAEEPITEADAIEAVATTEAGWGDEDIDLTESDSESFAFGQTSEKTSNGVAQAEESVSKNVKEAQNAELRSGDVSVEAERVGTFPSNTGEVELHVEVGNGDPDPIEPIDSPESGWGDLDNVCSDNEPDDKGVEGTSLRDEPLDTNGTMPQLNSPKEAVQAEISSPSSSAIAASSEMLLASPIASLVSPVDASGVKSPKSLVASANRRRYRSKKLGAKRLTKK